MDIFILEEIWAPLHSAAKEGGANKSGHLLAMYILTPNKFGFHSNSKQDSCQTRDLQSMPDTSASPTSHFPLGVQANCY